MKTRFGIALATAAALMLISPRPASGFVDISAGIQINARADFYAPLTPYGTWVNFSTYGRCWHPTEVGADWRPYSNGSWEWTDAGWYWASDEPWAWACYHYGSWYYDTDYGWIWIPGTDWSPAWVTWRYSDDYVGWAPCGPGISVLGPSFFVFCGAGHFTDHFSPRNLIINNTSIINRTTVVKNFNRETVNIDGRQQTVFADPGPGLDRIQRVTKHRFTPRPLPEVARQTPVPSNIRESRPAERNQPESQRFNQQPNREAVPPTGREQPRQFEQPRQPNQPQRNEQPNRETPPPTGREQPRQFEQPRQQPEQRMPQQPEQRQLQKPEQQRPEVTPPPTGREQPRQFEQPPPGQERRQEVPPREERPPTAPPSEKAVPPERALPPTGRENGPPQGHEAPPPRQEVRPGPESHGPPATPPGQERKDRGDQGP